MHNKPSSPPNDPANQPKQPSIDEWDKVIRLAWRPAWSIRSRRGCLSPFFSKQAAPHKK